jgi:hypothetical protein
MQTTTLGSVLQQIFRHTRYGQTPARDVLCRRLRLSPEALDAALGELERRRLLDAEKLRLTLAGLAVAVASKRPAPRVKAGICFSSAPPRSPRHRLRVLQPAPASPVILREFWPPLPIEIGSSKTHVSC